MSKTRALVIKQSLLVKFIGRISFIEFKRVLLLLANSDSGEGNEILFHYLSTNAERSQFVLKIVFEFMIT